MPSATDTLLPRTVAVVVFLALASITVWKGVLPALKDTRGDFANYFTAARLVAEHRPLATAYRDFAWFQKQIDRTGITGQLGGFIPHPPPNALIMLPLTSLDPLTAKRIWIVFNIALSILVVLLVAKITMLHWLTVGIILLSTGIGLINNFVFGQMYMLVLATIVGGVFLFQRGHPVLGGILLGLMIPVKYVGGFFLMYYVWKREWRFVLGAVASTIAMTAAIALLQGTEIFRVFLAEVLPRHLKGEIQEPFAIQFQSWNSMLRRLFVASPSLNPYPPMESPFLFSFVKQLIVWSFVASFIGIYRGTKFDSSSHQRLFEIGLIPLAVLLISPGSATYHFLLLSVSIVCFAKVLLDLGRPRHAMFLAFMFLLINLPHYLQARHVATGWLTPLGYPRLWLLVGLFLLVGAFFHRAARWRWKFTSAVTYAIPVLVLAGIMTALDVRSGAAREDDGAEWVPLHEAEFDPHLGLLVKSPDKGNSRIVFTYGKLLDENYAIFSIAHGRVEGQWTPDVSWNFYEPDLAANDRDLLLETIRNGRAEIWISRGRGEMPEFLLEGENPSWAAVGGRFVFLRDGRVGLASAYEPGSEPTWIDFPGSAYDVACSPVDKRIALCAQRAVNSFVLALVNPETGDHEILLQSEEPMERPAWSPDGSAVLFSWNRDGNRDIWGMMILSRALVRITRDPAIDTSPVWDWANRRVLFISDRGRGIEIGTMFSVRLPGEIVHQ